MCDDVLVFPNQPLARDLEITGPIVVHLFAATDGPDTDFTATLIDVFSGGTACGISAMAASAAATGRATARPSSSHPGRTRSSSLRSGKRAAQERQTILG
jgi:uncharacterized protein